MACTCKEDYEYQGNVRIGRNRVMCQECIDANERSDKQRQLQEKIVAIRELELANLRKIYDGEDISAVNAQRLAIRGEIQALNQSIK
jgi:hypothetical protein